MKTKSAILHVAVLVFMISAWALAIADAPPEPKFIKLERGNVDEIFADGDKATARFPVTLDGVQPESIELRIVDVVLGKRRESRLVDAFTPKMEPASEDLSQAISIELDLKKVCEQGTYNLAVDASTVEGSQRKILELQIIVPTATLRPPGAIVAEEVVCVPWWRSSLEKSPFQLNETSGRSCLTGVHFSHLPGSGDNLTIDGRLEFQSPVSTVPPRGTAPVNYKLNGNFPFGVTKGAIEVYAPQLAGPLTVNYEVRKRLYGCWIFVIILLGLVLGWAVKTRLRFRIELDNKLLEALDLKELINKEIQSHHDAEFRQALTGALAKLQEALGKKKTSVIDEEISEVNRMRSTALADLQSRRKAAETKFAELDSLAHMAVYLPDSIREPLRLITGQLEDVRQKLNLDDVKEARERLDEIETNLAETIQKAEIKWSEDVRGYLRALIGPNTLLPTVIIPKLEKAVDSLAPILDKVTNAVAIMTVEQIGKDLSAIAMVRKNVFDLMAQLQGWLQEMAAGISLILGEVGISDPAAVEHLKETIADFGKKAEVAVDRPEKSINVLPTDLEELHKAWNDALLKQIPETGNQEIDTVKKFIDSHKYAEAAQEVVQIIRDKRKKMESEGKPLGPWGREPTRLRSFALALSTWSADVTAVREPAVVTRIERMEAFYDPLIWQRSRIERNLFWDTFLQTVLVGALIAVVGYLLFAEKFIGTPQDIAGVFFWAFGIDITVDAVVQTAKGIKK
ncbi:MAG: hypothetical protein ACLQPD_11235 [Desulfomonilaceae bacterium]